MKLKTLIAVPFALAALATTGIASAADDGNAEAHDRARPSSRRRTAR